MATPVATLGGFSLAADIPVGWELSQGVEPHQRVFTLERGSADQLLEAAQGLQPQTLVVKGNGATLTVQRLFVLSSWPARAPYLTNILVSDGRFLWAREHHVAAYNVRRATGDKYLDLDNQQLVALVGTTPEVGYAKFSLYQPTSANPQAWTAKQMLEDVLKVVTARSGGYDLKGFDAATALPVEGVAFDDTGDQALRRALSFVPALTCYLDYDGVCQLTTRFGGGEADQLASQAPPVVGRDLVTQVDLADVRPSAVEVYFTPEQEVRFDYIENVAVASQARNGRDPRVLTNVLPLPDPHLDIKADNGKTRRVYQGTWVPINQNLLTAWNADPNAPTSVTIGAITASLPPITFDLICKFFFFPGGYSVFDEAFNGPNPVWTRRWAAIQQHYRRTYQIPGRWLDRLRTMLPVRAAVVDSVNGVRAPSSVYQNYTVIPTVRRLAQKVTDPTRRVGINCNVFNVGTYAYGSLPSIDGNVTPFPTAVVDVLDDEQGVLHVNVHPDAWGDYLQIIPSLCASTFGGSTLPSTDPADQGDATAGFLLGNCQLDTRHAASLVVTAVPASPNSLGQLHKITVAPDDARTMLPGEVAKRVGACRGPVWKLRVGPAVLTARFAWIDSLAPLIEASFFDDNPTRPLSMLVNDKTQLQPFAKAVAANLYASLADHAEGSSVSGWNPTALPLGRIDRVLHDLAPTGRALTELHLPVDRRGLDVFALLPESVRRQVLGLVGAQRRA